MTRPRLRQRRSRSRPLVRGGRWSGRRFRGGRNAAGPRSLWPSSHDRGSHVLEAGRVGHRLGHRRDPGRVLLGVQALEEGRHLGLEGGDHGRHPFGASLHGGRVGLHLGIEPGLARGDARLGLFADARDLGLRPLADRGHVVVGLAAQVGHFAGRAGVDLFDDGLGLDLEARHRLVPRMLRRRLHRAAQLGHELRRAASGCGARLLRVVRRWGWSGGVDHLGCLGLLAVVLIGLARSGGPRKPEGRSCLGACHGARSSLTGWSDRSVRSPVRARIVSAAVGPVQLASGTSGLGRWYRASDSGGGLPWGDGSADRLRWAPRRDRHARSSAARPAHLGDRPLQLPLHVLHAEGDLRSRLRVPAEGPGPELRGDRAAGPGLRRAGRREAADHRRRAARPARPAGSDRDARRAPATGR